MPGDRRHASLETLEAQRQEDQEACQQQERRSAAWKAPTSPVTPSARQ
jgi:hypothetical protein